VNACVNACMNACVNENILLCNNLMGAKRNCKCS